MNYNVCMSRAHDLAILLSEIHEALLHSDMNKRSRMNVYIVRFSLQSYMKFTFTKCALISHGDT